MPDQLPSAILESTNSFDSIFALDIDTKQRFDNILNNQQKPIDYPIPDYNKDFSPQGLPQDDLLSPQKMKGSLGEALFSSDPRIADLAVNKMRTAQSNLPVSHGIGAPDRFQYSKEMDKFLNGDYGYNPYLSLEDNEDFNYRYDYMSHTGVGRLLRNIGTGTARFVGSVALKLGQTLGYMGSMISEGVQEIFNGKDNNFMADVADNSLSRWFEGLEEDMKNSNLLSVFKPKGWDDMGFFKKLGNGAFWTDEIADGAAFMGEMIASMYLLGGLGKIGSVGRFGATEINLTKALSKLGPVGRYGGKGIDAILKTATGSKNLSDVGRWAFSTTSESAFEAAQLYKTRKEELKAQRQSGQNSYTDEEIEVIAGDSAAASFKANMLILSASNAFENRFIFNPLFKKFRGETPNPRSRLISVSEETDKLDNLARASRTEYNYSTWLGKKLNLKDPNSRLRFYGSRGLSAFAAEGLWEENAQLAVERLASVDNLSFNTFVNKIGNQTVGAFTGSDKEAQTAIGLGTVIGIGGTGIVSKVAGGDKERYKIDPNTGLIQRDANGKPLTEKVPLLQRGERRKREYDTATAVAIYEQYRRKFLNFQDIYVRDEQTGKPVLDEDDNLQIDDIKAAALLDGINAFASKQEAASKVYDPMFRKFLQDNAMTDFVTAAKSAGIFDRSMKRFSSLGSLSAGELQNLGFDPNTVIDHTYLKDSMKEFGNLYDKAQNSFSTLGKDDTQEDDDSRKNALFKASATVYSTGKILNEYQSAMMERDFPSAFSPEAEGNTSEIQQYNSLVRQKESLDQWSELAKENGNFYEGFIRSEKRRIESEMARLEAILDDMMENTDINLKLTPRGFVVSDTKYDALKLSGEENYTYTNAQNLKKGRKIRSVLNAVAKKIGTEIDMNIDIEEQAQKKHAELTNERARQQYLINKFSSVQNGIKNYKDYIKFHDSIQKKDGKADEGLTPPPNAPTNPNATPPSNGPVAPQTGTTAPINPVAPPASEPISKKEALAAEAVVSKLTTLLSKARAAFISGDPDVSPDFKSIANLINENPQHKDVIIKLLKKYAEDYGQAVIDQIQNGTYNPEGVVVRNYQITSEFFIEVTPSIEDDDIVNAVNDYLDSVDAMIESYKEPELSELEVNAVAVLRPLNLQNTALVAYAGPINDPNASAKDVKDALRGISDQLLDQNTAEVTGTALGQAGSQAIEDLGYEAPAKLEIETKLEEAPKVNSKDDLIAAQKADIERRRQEELNQQTDAGYSIIALDYLFTGGRDVILSTDYLLQALVGGFTYSAKEINDIRNKYADKLGNIKDDINSGVYNQMMNEIRDVINKNYNDSKATEIFDKILKNATGFTNREGNQTSIELDKLNEQNESKINAKYDAELAALEESEGSALKDVEGKKADIEKEVLGSFANTIQRIVNSKGPSNGKTIRTELTSKISSDGEVIVFKSKNTFADDGRSVISSPASMTIEEFKEHFYPMLTADEIEMFEETLEVYKKDGWNGRIFFKELRVGSSKATNLKGQLNLDIMIGMGNDYGFTLTKKLTDTELDTLENKQSEPNQSEVEAKKADIERRRQEELNQSKVILPIGTSGSGKSTFIKSLPQENLVVIELDAMRVEFTEKRPMYLEDILKEYTINELKQGVTLRSLQNKIEEKDFETIKQAYNYLKSEEKYKSIKNSNEKIELKIKTLREVLKQTKETKIGSILTITNDENVSDYKVKVIEIIKHNDYAILKVKNAKNKEYTIKVKSDGTTKTGFIEDFVFKSTNTEKIENIKLEINNLKSQLQELKPDYSDYYINYFESKKGDINDKSKDKEIYIEAAKRAIQAIKEGKQVVFDTTNLTKDKRLPFIEAIKKEIPTANIQYKLMELNPELAKQRIKAQLERGEKRAAVSDETIDRHAESYKQMLKDIKTEPITEFKSNEEINAKYDAELAALESNLITEDTNEAAIDKLGDEKLTTEQEEQSALKVGDRVVVNTKKDGTSTIKEIRGDKALLEDGRQVALSNLTLATQNEELSADVIADIKDKVAKLFEMQERGQISLAGEDFELMRRVQQSNPSTEDLSDFMSLYTDMVGGYQMAVENEEKIQPQTQAQQASADTEGSGVDNPPPPPEPPTPQENSDQAEVDQDNFIDIMVDEARKNGVFTFPQNMPEEIVMEGAIAKITNGAIQLKTTVSDQSRQLLRQHNILKNMGEQTNPENFWSEDEEGNRKYKVRLEMAGDLNAAKYTPWIYNTAKGLINPETGKPYRFPFIVAMVVDNDGNYVYFDDNGNIATKSTGMPFGFVYTVEDYKTKNLETSRRGNQLKNGEPLNGVHGFLTNDPLKTMSEAVAKGVPVIGDINMVTSGKLSTYNVDNSGSTWAKDPQQRTVRQMIDDGDLDESASMVLGKGRGSIMEYASERAPGAPSQRIKVGQPYILDDRSGYRIPLRGKKLKDLTVDGKPFVDGQLKAAIEKLQEDGTIFIDEDASPESQEILINLFNMIRALVYSQNTPLFMNEAKTKITLVDKRPTHIPLMETEINYSTGISILTNPFEENSEGFDYEEFVKENFLSGAVPAELVKGKKNFEKLNKRIIFTLEKNHQQLLDAIGAKADTSKVIRMQMTDYSKFVNKTFRKKGTTTGAITVTGYSDGKFTITGNGGTVTRTPEEFMKELRTLEEVKLPTPTDEVTDEMAKDIKLSKQKIDEIREQSKNMTDEDVNNLDFGC